MEFWKLNKQVTRMKDLSDGAKVLYSVISGLCKKEGYCFASNSKLGELCGVSARTIQRRIKELEGSMITVNRFLEGDIQRRNIFLNNVVTGEDNVTGGTKSVTPPMTNSVEGGTKSVTHNITSIIEESNRDNLIHKQLESNTTNGNMRAPEWLAQIPLDGDNSWRYIHRQVKGNKPEATLGELKNKCTLFAEAEKGTSTRHEWTRHFINWCKYQKFTPKKESSIPSATHSDWKK
jgi:hypothetical protein